MSSPYAGGTPSNGNYSPYYNNGMNSAKFNPTMAVIIIVLIGGCFVLGFVSIFVRKCLTGNRNTRTPTSGNGGWNPKSRGLDKEAVDALPIVHITDLDEKDDRECPVCLTEFEPEDNLRLLPVCKHIFHQECIDAWFDAHSTCPLCRASLKNVARNKTSGEPCAARDPAVPATATEVSESTDIDIELQSTAPEQDASEATMAPVGGTISREDSLTSARGTLSRNSQSFKRAARGTMALEKAQSLGAANRKPPTAPQTGNRKPPLTPASTMTGIRRSSSLGTDLMALRSLLMGGDQAASTRLASGPAAAAAAAQSNSWFARPRSMDSSRPLPRTHSSDKWSSIDLESAKPSGEGESSTAGQDRTWSDRWSLASLRGAMFPLSRSTSDITTRMASSRLPV